MKKLLIIIPIVLILAILAIVSLRGSDESDSAATTTPTREPNTRSAANPDSFSANILELIGMGRNIKCTFSDIDEDYQVSGTTYVAGERMRTDSVLLDDDEQMETHMIIKDKTMYTWTSEQTEGVMLNLEDFENMATEDETQEALPEREDYRDLQEEIDYSCSPWLVDETLFNPPENIQFQDLSTMFEGMQEAMEEAMEEAPSDVMEEVTDENACAACDLAPNEQAKNLCKQQLNCN